MTNIIEEKEIYTIKYDKLPSRKQRELEELLSIDNIFKKDYLKFCNYLNKYDDLDNIDELRLNAAILYRYNYKQIMKLKENLQSDDIDETILDFLLLVGNKDLRSISISANYLLDGEIISKIYSYSRMRDFENFKEQIITTIVFRTNYLNEKTNEKIDINKLIEGLGNIHKPKIYHRVRA